MSLDGIFNRVKNLLPHTALKSLYYTLIHSHMTYGIHAWGNASSIAKLFVLQKRAIRIINNNKYRTHTEPLFKSENILKITDLYKMCHYSCSIYKMRHYHYHLKRIYINGTLLIIVQCIPDNTTSYKKKDHEQTFQLNCRDIILRTFGMALALQYEKLHTDINLSHCYVITILINIKVR